MGRLVQCAICDSSLSLTNIAEFQSDAPASQNLQAVRKKVGKPEWRTHPLSFVARAIFLSSSCEIWRSFKSCTTVYSSPPAQNILKLTSTITLQGTA
jgi:hypothetical protein